MTSLCLCSFVNNAKIADSVDAIGPCWFIGPGLVSWKTGDNADGRLGDLWQAPIPVDLTDSAGLDGIPEMYHIPANQLSSLESRTKGPGNYAAHITKLLFPELFFCWSSK
jgi:hypothetical protein